MGGFLKKRLGEISSSGRGGSQGFQKPWVNGKAKVCFVPWKVEGLWKKCGMKRNIYRTLWKTLTSEPVSAEQESMEKSVSPTCRFVQWCSGFLKKKFHTTFFFKSIFTDLRTLGKGHYSVINKTSYFSHLHLKITVRELDTIQVIETQGSRAQQWLSGSIGRSQEFGFEFFSSSDLHSDHQLGALTIKLALLC